LIRESAKTHSKTLAKEAEKKRRRELETGYNSISEDNRSQRILTLREVAKEYSAAYALRHTPKSVKYSELCIKHIVQHLGDKMLIEITDRVVETYQLTRIKEGAAGKTTNEEVGELFRIMGDAGDAVRLRLRKAKKLKLKQREDCGRALTVEEEARILAAASAKAEIAERAKGLEGAERGQLVAGIYKRHLRVKE
jgi:hypothetical protein